MSKNGVVYLVQIILQYWSDKDVGEVTLHQKKEKPTSRVEFVEFCGISTLFAWPLGTWLGYH